MPKYELDLDAAYADVLAEAIRDEVPDVLHHADFGDAWSDIRAELVAQLEAGTYRPLPATIVEVPKSRLATRPIAVLHLRDRILYQAIMREIAPHIDGFLSEEVRSARLRKGRSPRLRIAKQSNAWARFQERGRELCEEYAEVCLLSTDITSYFEFIDLDRLQHHLRGVPGIDNELANLLLVLLRGLTDDTTNLHGVPQGPEVSSLLGNLYLMPLDATLRSLGLKFLRFQDDIKVFAGEQHELRRALLELMPVVRSLHINLSSAKTRILTGSDVLDHFEDMEKDALQYGINIKEPGVSEKLQDFFDRAVGGDEVNERDVRFAVYRFEKLGDPHAVRWIMKNLVDVPYLASLLVRYLSTHLSNADLRIETGVRNYLNDPTQNLSSVVELHLIRMLANAPKLEDATMELAWRTLRDQNKHPSVRQFAARCIGRHARHGDGAVLQATFQAAVDNPPLRRALLIALVECGVATRGFLKKVAQSDSDLAPTARYLRGVTKLPAP